MTAHDSLYIIGGYDGKYKTFSQMTKNNYKLLLGSYLGDIWEFDFETMKFAKLSLEGPDVNAMSRSNHTAVYYAPHEA